MMDRCILLSCAALLAAVSCAPGGAAKAPRTPVAVAYGAEIELVEPDPAAGLSVNEALRNRRSWREYAPEALALDELSGVLWAASGVNRPAAAPQPAASENSVGANSAAAPQPDAAEGGATAAGDALVEVGRSAVPADTRPAPSARPAPADRLTAPSALALYPICVYAVFQQGVYRYDPARHVLLRVAEGDLRRLAGTQPFVFTAPLNLVYVADLAAYAGRDIPAEKVRYLCGQDAAGYAQNVNLYAAGHSLRSITRGSVPEAELLDALGLDSARWFVALAQTVGK